MNPPYGREIGQWVEKAFRESRNGTPVVVALLPARTDTAWWHDFVASASEIRYLKGRLHFNEARTGAPFPSAVVVFWSPAAGGRDPRAVDGLRHRRVDDLKHLVPAEPLALNDGRPENDQLPLPDTRTAVEPG